MSTLWDKRFSLRAQELKSSAIRELLKLTQMPDVISFAGGLPAPELFPVERIREASDTVLAEMGSTALQYSTTEGYVPLRQMIADNMSRYGINATVDNIMITPGSQQALDQIGKILINPGDSVLVEAPTYLGALQAFNFYQAKYITVPDDDEGIIADEIEPALRQGAKFMYLLPNYQNPSGVTIAGHRRSKIVALSNRYGIPIVEDDPYGALRFEGDHIAPIIVLDAKYIARYKHNPPITGNVIYLSTFSKTLAPGMRVAWVVAPAPVIHRMVQAKQSNDLHSSTLDQMIAYEAARDGFLDAHVKTIRDEYKRRRDVMLEAFAAYFPPEVTWTRPQGGLFLWVRFPEGINSSALLNRAMEKKVAFVPGKAFYPEGSGGGDNCARLNFSNAKPDLIVEGVKRLGQVIKEALAAAQPAPA